MKLTEEEKQRIEKYSARIIAEAEISSIADKLFPKIRNTARVYLFRFRASFLWRCICIYFYGLNK
jgi:hypothetical protein